MRLLRAQVVCGSCTGGVRLKNTTGCVLSHRHSFDAHASAGHITSRGVFAWTRAIIEAIVKSKRASSPGNVLAAVTGGVCQLGHVTIPAVW